MTRKVELNELELKFLRWAVTGAIDKATNYDLQGRRKLSSPWSAGKLCEMSNLMHQKLYKAQMNEP